MPRYEFDPETMEVPPGGEVRYTKKGTPWVYRPPRPYEAGNLESVRSGAWSEQLVGRDTQEQLALLQEHCPYVVGLDGWAVEDWLTTRVKFYRLSVWMDKVEEREGIEAVKDTHWKTFAALAGQLLKQTDGLGLNPTSRARLLRDTGFAKQLASRGMDDLLSTGRELRRLK